jgi:ABC-2 type transport system ATP-binding protein
VTAVQKDGRVVRLQVQGTVEPLLKVLAASGVRELLSREPSLEELFLAHYGTGSETASASVHAS